MDNPGLGEAKGLNQDHFQGLSSKLCTHQPCKVGGHHYPPDKNPESLYYTCPNRTANKRQNQPLDLEFLNSWPVPFLLCHTTSHKVKKKNTRWWRVCNLLSLQSHSVGDTCLCLGAQHPQNLFSVFGDVASICKILSPWSCGGVGQPDTTT